MVVVAAAAAAAATVLLPLPIESVSTESASTDAPIGDAVLLPHKIYLIAEVNLDQEYFPRWALPT